MEVIVAGLKSQTLLHGLLNITTGFGGFLCKGNSEMDLNSDGQLQFSHSPNLEGLNLHGRLQSIEFLA